MGESAGGNTAGRISVCCIVLMFATWAAMGLIGILGFSDSMPDFLAHFFFLIIIVVAPLVGAVCGLVGLIDGFRNGRDMYTSVVGFVFCSLWLVSAVLTLMEPQVSQHPLPVHGATPHE